MVAFIHIRYTDVGYVIIIYPVPVRSNEPRLGRAGIEIDHVVS